MKIPAKHFYANDNVIYSERYRDINHPDFRRRNLASRVTWLGCKVYDNCPKLTSLASTRNSLRLY